MANFTTHLAFGTLVSGALATVTMAADVVAPENLIAVTMAGLLGSVLPDIDLKDSRPSKAMFSGLAVFFSFVVLFNAVEALSIVEMFVVWLGTLAFVRYGAKAIFHSLSYHRGIWHSILAAVFCSVVTAIVYYYLLRRPDGVAWLAAGFLFVGFMTHLVLDEIYSVDVMDVRLKQSFGTAVKLADFAHLGHTAAMAASVALAIYLAPPLTQFTEGITSKRMWVGLQARLLPVDRERWFGIDWPRLSQRARTWRTGETAAPSIAGGTGTSTGPSIGTSTGSTSTAATPARDITTGTIPAKP